MIPSGAQGTLTTLKTMRRIVREAKKSLTIRVLALKIARSAGSKQFAKEAKLIQQWVKNNIAYRRDIRGVETLSTPDKTLEFRAGDCDDQSILVASLLESIGHPTRFVAVGFIPGKYSHVLTETLLGTKWVALETTEKRAGFGWFPKNVRSVLRINN